MITNWYRKNIVESGIKYVQVSLDGQKESQYKEYVQEIMSGRKIYEFRKKAFKRTVYRIYIYILRFL